ncbi:hypothetical protein CH275_10240 [Rhodococcus sp. 06-235-1A]|uniref:MarR family winged helix-turn-helix transcriptional regulator n=1 Tax=Rhodococcus sp. 06-235-1A TaxID=2022508 RepID=UPI000B9B766B|nr:MarR family winged helix-turn-helix transcriptional regulator [Rhodococcus sp. 06-235-1A]OZD06579.1 hypothetical protein CH275_10240 [Rhodococcus sp. 06-235-1A]
MSEPDGPTDSGSRTAKKSFENETIHAALAEVAVRGALLRECIPMFEQYRDESIETAIDAGATWTQLAKALGVTPQAVHKRFGARGATTLKSKPLSRLIDRSSGAHPHGISHLVMVRLGRLAELTNRATDNGIGVPYGLRRTELRILRVLDSQSESQGVAELGRLCGVDKASVSRAVHQLLTRGLIDRTVDSAESAAHFCLSPAGTRLTGEMAPLALARQEIVLGPLPAAGVNAILDVLSSNLEKLLDSTIPDGL